MDRQFTQVGVRKFAATAAADPRIYFERLVPVAPLALFGVAASLGQYPVELGRVTRGHTALRTSLRVTSPMSIVTFSHSPVPHSIRVNRRPGANVRSWLRI